MSDKPKKPRAKKVPPTKEEKMRNKIDDYKEEIESLREQEKILKLEFNAWQ